MKTPHFYGKDWASIKRALQYARDEVRCEIARVPARARDVF